MKIGFIGCVKSSEVALQALLNSEIKDCEIVAVVTKEKSKFNNDFRDLSELSKKYSIPFIYDDSKYEEKAIEFMNKHSPDIIYCIGWSYLLSESFLSIPNKGIIGFHPTELPSNRGRHPLIWSLVLGLNQTASTFFVMKKGADEGPIISQEKVIIDLGDNAASLYEKILNKLRVQIIEITKQFIAGEENLSLQDDSKSNYWRKRTKKDGMIDWRMNAIDIYNLVRALSFPYSGAEFQYQNKYISVEKAIISQRTFAANIEPGLVLEGNSTSYLIKCSGIYGIWIYPKVMKHNISVGEYL